MRKVFTFLLFSCLTYYAQAQEDSTKKILYLDEMVVSANKFEQARKESANKIELITSKQIAFQNSPNMANLLEQSGNVFVQRSQAGGGSPVLRGFEANRVLIVVDGVRLNNAIFRAGHLQNVLRIDQSMLERAEVIFGPSSVMYGSDALGGVMHFRSKSAAFDSKSANAYLRYSSAFGEKTGHVDFNLGSQKIASLTSFTFSDFGDVIQGNNRLSKYPDFGKRLFYSERVNSKDVMQVNDKPNVQVGSGYQQYDFLEKLSFQQSENVKHTLNIQYSNTSNVPRYDRLSELRNGLPRNSEWYYGPEKRAIIAYQLDLKNTQIYDQAFVSVAFQSIVESRNSRNFNNDNRKEQTENVGVFSVNADFQKRIKSQKVNYGLEVVNNDLSSTAVSVNIVSGATKAADTRYPDGKNNMNSWALYLTDQLMFSNKHFLNAGLRYSSSRLSSEFIEKTFFPFPFNTIKQNNDALTGNIGLVLNLSTKTKLSVLGSSGFRTPNIDDLSKVFESVSGSLIVPNPDLKPEYSYNAEVTLSQMLNENIRLEGTIYNTWLRNVIVVDNFTLNGQSLVEYDGEMSKVLASQNKDKATINGWNINVFAKISENLNFSSTLNGTKGKASDGIPLDHIPPIFGRSGLKYSKEKVNVEVFSLYNGWKKIEDYSPSGEDNQQYATPEGMPSWWTLNLRTSFQLQKHLSLQLACENILDKNYRNFASGISSAGRNFMITLRGGI
ncbi:TonB-dependent receptor [Lacihabitans sp. LS3-19]|nr:TonB-dependent receptor [Lacihabitans sp. LS3-19]